MWLAWKVRLIPSLARSHGWRLVTSWPNRRTSPVSGEVKPLRTSNSVDFPAPFGPMSPTKV